MFSRFDTVYTKVTDRRRQSVTVHAALLSLHGRQREMRYLHHYTQRRTLCRVIRRQLKTELYIRAQYSH